MPLMLFAWFVLCTIARALRSAIAQPLWYIHIKYVRGSWSAGIGKQNTVATELQDIASVKRCWHLYGASSALGSCLCSPRTRLVAAGVRGTRWKLFVGRA